MMDLAGALPSKSTLNSPIWTGSAHLSLYRPASLAAICASINNGVSDSQEYSGLRLRRVLGDASRTLRTLEVQP